MKLIIVIFTSFLIMLPNLIFAQCCGAGNPVNSFGEYNEIAKNTLIISPVYKYSYSNQYYTGTEKSEISPDMLRFNFVSLDLNYGITYRLRAQGQLGYFFDKTKTYNIAGWNPMRGFGFGDAAISMRYVVLNKISEKFNITAEIGSKLPVGVFDQEVDNVKLPISLQPSSGSFRHNAAVFANKAYKKYIFSLRTMFEYSSRIQSDNFDYKYGNLYLISAYTAYQLTPKFNILAQIRYEYRCKSIRENEHIIESTGGQVLFFVPQITYLITNKTGLSIFADIPIYRNINGTQIANKFSLSVKLIRNLDLNKIIKRNTAQ